MSYQNRADAHFKEAQRPEITIGWDPDYPRPARRGAAAPVGPTKTSPARTYKDKAALPPRQALFVAVGAVGYALSLSARLVAGVARVSVSCLVFVCASLSAATERQRHLADRRRHWRQASNEARQDAYVQQSRQSSRQGRAIEVKVTTKVKVHV